MLVDIVFDSHLYRYSNTGNEFHCVMVLATDYMLVDTMFEFHFYGYISSGKRILF